jgi:predicted GIY-YIG superfamily endonuclease
VNNSSVHTLYRFFDAQGQLLYVGLTENVASRWRQHNTFKPRWADVATATLEHFATREKAAAAEVRAIEQERPLWNIKTHREASRPKPIPRDPRTAPSVVVGNSDDMLTASQVAAEFRVSTSTVRRWETYGLLVPTARTIRGAHRRYSRADLDAFKQRAAGAPAQDWPMPA